LRNRLVTFGFAAALTLTATATLCPSQVVSDSNREVVGALPDTVELVVGATDLASLRARPQTRALERFLNDASDWSRTTAAWTDLARKLDMSFEESIHTLLGRGAVIASESPSVEGTSPSFAVLSSIKAAVRRDLTRRLETVPRSVICDATIMSLEQGAYHVATRSLTSPAPDQSQLILSSDASLFGRVVQSMSGRAGTATLSQLPEWTQIAPLADSDLFLLARRLPAPDKPGTYLALAGTPTPLGWTARFSASDSVMDDGVADVRSTAAWPSEAVDQLEAGASLLVAGSPHAAIGKPPTLMAGLLAMMNLPPDLRSQLDGAAIISLSLPRAPHTGTSLIVALPLRDIPSGVDIADAWVQSIAGVDPLAPEFGVTITDGVRETSITPDNPAIINGFVRSEGRMAWCYAAAGGIIQEKATPGWVVVALRFGTGEDPLAMVRRTASLLAHDEGKDKQTLFRLIVEPRQLSAWLAANPSKAPAAPAALAAGETGLAVSQPAMRWLNRVDSRIVREAPGYVEGAVTLELNLALLEVSAATPATNKDQPTSPERQ